MLERICNNSGDIHFNQENCNRKHPAGTRDPRDVFWRSSKGSKVRDLQGTFRGLSGDQYKIDDFMKKLFFRSNSSCITYLQRYYIVDICFCFLQEEQIFQNSKRVLPRHVYGIQLRDVPGTKWWDFLGTSVGRRSNMFFKFSLQTIKLTLTGYSKFSSDW